MEKLWNKISRWVALGLLVVALAGWTGVWIFSGRLREADTRLQDQVRIHFKQLEAIRSATEDITRGLEHSLERSQSMERDAQELAKRADGLEQKLILIIGKANGFPEAVRGIIEAIERLGSITQSLFEQTILYRKTIETMEN